MRAVTDAALKLKKRPLIAAKRRKRKRNNYLRKQDSRNQNQMRQRKVVRLSLTEATRKV